MRCNPLRTHLPSQQPSGPASYLPIPLHLAQTSDMVSAYSLLRKGISKPGLPSRVMTPTSPEKPVAQDLPLETAQETLEQPVPPGLGGS